MGYHKMRDAYSRATSPMKAIDEEPENAEKEETDHLTQEQYAALSLQHAEELKELQEQYEYVLMFIVWWNLCSKVPEAVCMHLDVQLNQSNHVTM